MAKQTMEFVSKLERSEPCFPWRPLFLFLVLLSSDGCTWLCNYTASAEVVVPSGASKSLNPPLDEVVSTAIEPLGFSNGHKIHIPGGPLGHHKSEPDHDYVDFEIGVPYKSFLPPENQVMVRIESASGMLSIDDLRHSATQPESPFVKTVRQAIESKIQSTYGITTDIRRVKVTSGQCVQVSWP